MAVKMNLWSLTLLPGEPVSMLVPRDFVLTQAALGEDLKSADGRSVIKVTHQPIPAEWFDSDDEDSDDEELDSDLEAELADEFELSEDDEEEAPKSKKEKKVNGDAEEGDDEEEDDEEDDEDFSDDEEMAETNVICSLLAGRVEQASVNLTFTEGEAIQFEVTGENAVHLMGNYINQMPQYMDSDDEDDSEFDSEDYDDYSELYGDEEDDDEESATIEEIDEKPAAPAKKEKKAAPAPVEAKPKAEAKAAPAAAPKRKAEDLADTSMASAASTDGLSKNQKKKLAKKAKLEGDAAPAPAAAKPKAEQKSNKVRA